MLHSIYSFNLPGIYRQFYKNFCYQLFLKILLSSANPQPKQKIYYVNKSMFMDKLYFNDFKIE